VTDRLSIEYEAGQEGIVSPFYETFDYMRF